MLSKNGTEIKELIDSGNAVVGKGVSANGFSVYLWLWKEDDCYYLAHGKSDQFGYAIAEEIDASNITSELDRVISDYY